MVSETPTHSFVIRIWLEERDEATERVIWRGHVTHVLSREQRYVQSLEEISDFIRVYVEQMGKV